MQIKDHGLALVFVLQDDQPRGKQHGSPPRNKAHASSVAHECQVFHYEDFVKTSFVSIIPISHSCSRPRITSSYVRFIARQRRRFNLIKMIFFELRTSRVLAKLKRLTEIPYLRWNSCRSDNAARIKTNIGRITTTSFIPRHQTNSSVTNADIIRNY